VGSEGPEDQYLELLTRIVDQYPDLWVTIVQALADYHRELKTRAEIEAKLSLRHDLEIPLPFDNNTRQRWSFGYIFDRPEDPVDSNLVYYVDFENWKIVEVVAIY
jgi:hypothetical protein